MRVRFLAAFLLCVSAPGFSQKASNPAVERKIDALLKQMTVEEKAGQLSQYSGPTPENLDLVKKGLVGSLLNDVGAEAANSAQHIAVDQTRLKIPLLFGFDVIHGFRTIFPVPIASAGSFDPELVEQAERVAAKEATASGVKWTFAPMVDLARDPRWGRSVEGGGEDPYLGSVMAAARVRGFQGKSIADPESVVACTKHYVAYGGVEGGRDYNTVDMSEQTLREMYLPPFHAAVEAGSGTLMSAFESLNGVSATANHHTLTDILRTEWKFPGFVVSDYGSVMELIPHGMAADGAQAALLALTAGTDMDMAAGDYAKSIPDLIKSGKLSMKVLDEAVRRVLRVKFEAGIFEHPYFDPKREQTELYTAENLQVSRKLAQESMVLLKNQNNLLPLDKNTKTIAVIGPLANNRPNQLGSWVGDGRTEGTVTPLEGIKAAAPNAQLLYAKGVEIEPYQQFEWGGLSPAPTGATGAADTAETSTSATIDGAVSAAQKADVVIMVLGELASMSGEASSRASLDLPGKQRELLEAVLNTGKPVVLVLESGRPLDIRFANDRVPAIVQAWYLGSQAGNAIGDVLFGDASPSGRLPVSWPRSIGQIPVYYNHKSTGRPTSPDRWHTGYLDESKDPLYPFGYGLTYTSFKYSNLHVTPSVAPSGVVKVSAEVQNTGSRSGTELVQLYVHDRVAPTTRPVRELKGFSRVTLATSESKTVEFSVKATDLGSYDPQLAWVVPAGTYDVWVAPNSAEAGAQGMFEVAGK